MKKHNFYRILRYLSRSAFYPDGADLTAPKLKFSRELISELRYYDYIEYAGKNYRITVKGREALQIHRLTVANTFSAIAAAVLAAVSLFCR